MTPVNFALLDFDGTITTRDVHPGFLPGCSLGWRASIGLASETRLVVACASMSRHVEPWRRAQGVEVRREETPLAAAA